MEPKNTEKKETEVRYSSSRHLNHDQAAQRFKASTKPARRISRLYGGLPVKEHLLHRQLEVIDYL